MHSHTHIPARNSATRLFSLTLRGLLLAALTLAITPSPQARALALRPVTVTIWDVEQLGGSFDLTTLGDFFARISINGIMFETDRAEYINPFDGYIIPTHNLLDEPWTYTHEAWDSHPATVHIEIWDDDEPDSDDRADINPTSKEVLDLQVDMETGKWTGDVNWPESCIAGPFDLDLYPHSVRICFDINIISESGDLDEDGLLDTWEQKGVNYDGDGTIDFDLPRFGANPYIKDLFVEVDCVVALDHTHCPTRDAITYAVRSFAESPYYAIPVQAFGIQLHVDTGLLFGAPQQIFTVTSFFGAVGTYGDFGGGGDQIPEVLGNQIIESFSEPKGNGVPFADLKLAYFDNRRAPFVRYSIFGHQTNYAYATNDCTSGEASGISGHDFFVTLGGIDHFFLDPCYGLDANGFSVGTSLEQAGSFMHELGHTLGLRHGGDQDIPEKKNNYLSVMNYAFQMCEVPTSPVWSNGLPGGCDYSRWEMPGVGQHLDEDSLDECIGIDGGILGPGGIYGIGFSPIDWDNDGLLEGASQCQPPNSANVQVDINRDGIRTLLTGYDDWKNLDFFTALSGGPGTGGVPNEANPETIRQAKVDLAEVMFPGVVVDKTGPATAVPGDVLEYSVEITNPGPGPAFNAVLTDTAPDGSSQDTDLGLIVVGSVSTHPSTFTVPMDACPGDLTEASASVAFEDIVGNQLSASDTVALEILDVSAPTLEIVFTPDVLWPPDHKLMEVTAEITVTDNCDPNPAITLVSITSNEPETGFLGSGDKGPDILDAAFGTDDRVFSLRAERATGGQNTGREYTITYEATDSSGNTGTTTVILTVPTSFSRIH